MTWPTTAVTTTNTDQTTDNPVTARADILQAMQNANAMQSHIGSAEIAIASAATTDLGAQASNRLSLTGSATITGFGTVYSSGPIFVRIAAGAAPVFTQNATTLITPFAATFTGAAGDCFIAYPKATAGTPDGWVMGNYQQASAAATRTALGAAASGANADITALTGITGGINEARGTVAMNATAMNLWAQPNIIDGTGSAVTITAITNAPQAGARRVLYPITGTVINNGATFAVDGAANYTTLAGDKLEFDAITTSTYKVHVTKANGTAVVSVAGGLGIGQSWQNPTRALGTTYTNSTGNTIFIGAAASAAVGNSIAISSVVDGFTVGAAGGYSASGTEYFSLSFPVSPGSTYSVNSFVGTATLFSWAELR